jgi:hypothetical protein
LDTLAPLEVHELTVPCIIVAAAAAAAACAGLRTRHARVRTANIGHIGTNVLCFN